MLVWVKKWLSLSEHFYFGTVLSPRVSQTYLWQVTASWILGWTVSPAWGRAVWCWSNLNCPHWLCSFFFSKSKIQGTGEINTVVCKGMFSLLPSSKKLWQLCSVYYKGSCHRQTSRCLLLNLQPSLRNLSRVAGTCPAFLKPSHGNMTPFLLIS